MEKFNHNESLIYSCAVQYALGRMTYIPLIIQKEVLDKWDLLNDQTKNNIIKDVKESIESGNCGMEMDKKSWLEFLEKIKVENK